MTCTQEYCDCAECVARWQRDRIARWERDRNARRSAAIEQPAPLVNDSTPIADLVRADIDARVALGLQRYGTKLQANNGRDALVDAYQEAIDLVFYLRQVIEERGRGRT